MSHMEEDFVVLSNWFKRRGRKKIKWVQWVLVGSREMNGSGSVNSLDAYLYTLPCAGTSKGEELCIYNMHTLSRQVTWLGNGSGRKDRNAVKNGVLNRQRALVINLGDSFSTGVYNYVYAGESYIAALFSGIRVTHGHRKKAESGVNNEWRRHGTFLF